MYDGCRAGFYLGVCVEVYTYIDLYEDVEVHDGCEAGFL